VKPNLLVLQQQPFFDNPDAVATLFVVGFLGLVLIAGVVNAVRTGGGRRKKDGRTGFSRWAFRRDTRKLGLSRDQISFLMKMIKSSGVQAPGKLLHSGAYRDGVFRNAVEAIRENDSLDEDSREARIAEIFRIKRVLDVASERAQTLKTSKNLRLSQEIEISLNGTDWFESQIVSNLGERFGVEVPYLGEKAGLKPEKGSRIFIRVRFDNDRIFQFASRVIGYGMARKLPTVFLDHVSDIKRVQKRRFPRREMDKPAYFYPVGILETGKGRKKKKQAVVDKSQRRYAAMLDISAGGCALKAHAPLAAGTLVKIEFETPGGEKLSVFGKVRRLDASPPRGGIMRVMFTAVSRKYLNAIQSFVYGLEEDSE
jgi:hypothetical protein